jgi:hypothetical protein
VQQHLTRQAGVAKVDVELIDGKVTVYPKPDARLDPAHLLKATFDSGVSVAEMTMTAGGWVDMGPGGGLVFKISGDQVFPVISNALALELQSLASAPAKVTLRGVLYRKPAGRARAKPKEVSLQFDVLEIVKKE